MIRLRFVVAFVAFVAVLALAALVSSSDRTRARMSNDAAALREDSPGMTVDNPSSKGAKTRASVDKEVVQPREVILQLGSGTEIHDGRFMNSPAANAILAAAKAEVCPAISFPKVLLDGLRKRAQENAAHELIDLSSFFSVIVPEGTSKDAVEALRRQLAAELAPQVSYVQRGYRLTGDILPPATPDLTHANPATNGTSYLDTAPMGVDADFAASLNLRGQGMTLCDVERAWNLAHEDFMALRAIPLVAQSRWFNSTTSSGGNHGTSTLGVLAADPDAPGIRGLASGAQVFLSPTELRLANGNLDPTYTARNAIVIATMAMIPGTMILLEVQDDYSAFETFPLEQAIVEQATALGIHVIEPAGNGYQNLNVPDPTNGRRAFDLLRTDTGGIIVGAARSSLSTSVFDEHDPMPFSNTGHCVDTYAWGENVTTTGTGGAFAAGQFDPNQRYTHAYSGTSSAGSIVAGSAALMAQAFRQKFGQDATPRQLRNHMSLGTPDTTGQLGYMPDLRFQHALMQKAGVIEHVFRGNFDNRTLGRSAAALPDIDGDGVRDFIVGDPEFDGLTIQRVGRVIVYSGRTGAVIRTHEGAAYGDKFGFSLAAVGDLDQDGRGDYAVGIPGADGGWGDAGEVQVFSGRTGVLFMNAVGTYFNEEFGYSIAPTTMFGAPSLIVGVPGANNNDGEVRVLFVMTSPALLVLSGTAQGTGGRFGHSVASFPDRNNDACDEIIVGAPMLNVSTNAVKQGAAFLYNGHPFTNPGLLIQRWLGENFPTCYRAQLGWSVAPAGDFDRDGTQDLVFGSPGYSNQPGGPTYRGRVYIVSGRTWGTLYTETGSFVRANLGWSVAGVGDYDGDGFDDVAVGEPHEVLGWIGSGGSAPGHAYIIHGPLAPAPKSDVDAAYFTAVAASPVPAVLTFPQPPQTIIPAPPANNRKSELWQKEWYMQIGYCVAAAGDMNGDGRADVIVGAPGNGRAYVIASRPGRYPFMKFVGFVANEAAQEVFDVDNNTWAGGSTSPESSQITTFAPGLTGLYFRTTASTTNTHPLAQGIVATYGTNIGQLGGGGLGAHQFGRHPQQNNPPNNPNDLRLILGTEFTFRLDLSLDGVQWYNGLAFTKVTFVTEY